MIFIPNTIILLVVRTSLEYKSKIEIIPRHRGAPSRPAVAILTSQLTTTTMPRIPILVPLFTLALALGAHAHDNGMDMSMDGAMSLAEGNMLPYFHFTKGDMLWFLG